MLWLQLCTVYLTLFSYHVTYPFQNESTLYRCLNVKELLAQKKCDIWSLSDWNTTRTLNYLFRKWTLNHLAKPPNDWILLWVHIRMLHLTVWFYHVTHTFQVESTLYIYLNVKELLGRNRSNVSSLSNSNGTQNCNHLIRKQTLNHLHKLAKWLSRVVSTYLYSAYDCVFVSYHARLSEWIHSL